MGTINYNTIGINTLEKFKFVLDTEIGLFELKNAPLKWDSSSIELNRNLNLNEIFSAGILTNYESGSLVFVKDAFHILYGKYNRIENTWTKGLYLLKGVFAQAKLRVYYLNRTTLEYVEFPTSFKLDFNTLGTVRKDSGIYGVEIKALAVGFVTKLLQRKDTPVDLTKTESVGGYSIVDYTALKKNINIPQMIVSDYAKWQSGEQSNLLVIGTPARFIVNFPLIENDIDFTECQSVAQRNANVNISVTTTDCIFKQSVFERTLNIAGVVTMKTSNASLSGDLYVATLDTDGSTIINPNFISKFFYHPTIKTATSSQIDLEITLQIGQSLIVYIENMNPSLTGNSLRTFSSSINITETAINTAATTVQGMPYYEALERCLQLILDTQYPLKSDILGRLDVIKNADGDYYAAENQEYFGSILNGLCFRGLVLSDDNNSLAVTFQDLYKSISIDHNLGIGFEIIDGEPKIVIEPYEYFFPDTVGLDLSSTGLDRVNENEIGVEVYLDAAYSIIESGSKTFEYEAINGRGEYNTKNIRTNQIPNNKKLELIIPLRNDTKGMVLQLEKQVTGDDPTGTEDVKGDSDVWLLKTQRDGADEWQPELQENIQVLNNSSIFRDSSFNLYYTPTWVFLRNKAKIATGLDNVANSSVRFQVADKLANLETTNGTIDIIENQDIKVTATAAREAEVGEPFIDPEQLTVTVPFYEEDYATVVANPNYVVKLSDNYSGWILNLKHNLAKAEAEIKLIKKH